MSDSIIERKIDSKNRIILPIKDKDKIFLKKQDDFYILSTNREKLNSFSQEFERTAKLLKLEKLKEWFTGIEKLEIETITAKDLKESLNQDSDRIFKKKVTET